MYWGQSTLVQLESTCPLFSEKTFIYPHNDVMTFQFDSIYGRAGEIKTLNLSVNQLHNLESFDIRLNVDTQLVNVQSISIPELSHPWDEALISSGPDLNDPIIRGVNLPYLDSLDIGTSFDLAVLAFYGLFAIRVVQKMKLALVPFGSSNFSDYSSMPLYFLLNSILNC